MYRHHVLVAVLACSMLALALRARGAEDTPKASETRKKLKQKITVDFNSTRVEDAMEEITSQVKGIKVNYDKTSGVSRNRAVTYKAKDQSVEDVLDGMFKKMGYGYIVISKKGDAYDGLLLVRQSKERGRPLGEGDDPAETKKNDKDSTETKNSGKTRSKEKTAPREKSEPKVKPMPKETTEDDPDKAEQNAAQKLKFAKTLASDGKTEKAKDRLNTILKEFPTTKAAAEAKELLKKLEDKENKDDKDKDDKDKD